MTGVDVMKGTGRLQGNSVRVRKCVSVCTYCTTWEGDDVVNRGVEVGGLGRSD